MTDPAPPIETDVLIVGGGMVGASLAQALSGLPLTVTLLEAVPPQAQTQPSYDDRCTAIAWGSRLVFDALGLWAQFKGAATPIRTIHVSDKGRFGATRLDHREQQVEALGYVLENRILGQLLWRKLQQQENLRLLCPARIQKLDSNPGDITLSITQGAQLRQCRTRLLVVADGARSTTREMLGINARVHDYEQTAVITNITPQRKHNYTAYERFTGSGPLAMLPMTNGRCSVVWTLTGPRAQEVMTLDDPAFLGELQKDFGYRLGALKRTGTRQCYPLSLVRAEAVTARRSVLIGNAAHGLHPVAGQGFNLGLRDVAALAEVLADAGPQCDPGDIRLLRRYQHWRREDHDRVVSFTDNLVRLFGANAAPIQVARSAGLLAMDFLAAPRSALAQRSMGMTGQLPRLARGVPLF